jgi:hypothetical protein
MRCCDSFRPLLARALTARALTARALTARALTARALTALALTGAGACGGARSAAPVAGAADPSVRYVFSLHSELADDSARARRSRYEWQAIDRELAGRGFVVFGGRRSAGADTDAYADSVARRVRKLLADGVRPERITVAGVQQGGVIALKVASRVTVPGVNYVIMAGCPRRATTEQLRAVGRVQGRILSMYGEDDRQAGSCNRVFEQSPGPLAVREVEFANGANATYFYRPQRGWMNRLEGWAKEARAPLMVAPGATATKRR